MLSGSGTEPLSFAFALCPSRGWRKQQFRPFHIFQICDVNFADVAKTDDANFEDLYE